MDASGNLLNNGVLGANQNITLSGTGYVKTGARAITQPLILADLITGDVWTHSTGAPGVGAPAGGGTAFIPLKAIPDGARITGVTVYNDFATAGVSVVYTLHVNTAAAGGNQTNSFTAAIAGTSTTSTAANVSVAPTTPFTPNTGQTVWLKMVAAAAGTPPTFISMAISYDRP
jgi:hypothetical protein